MKKSASEIKYMRMAIGNGHEDYTIDTSMAYDEIHDEIIKIVRDMSPKMVARITTASFVTMNSFLLAMNGVSDIVILPGGDIPLSRELIDAMNISGQLDKLRNDRPPADEYTNSLVAQWLKFDPALESGRCI